MRKDTSHASIILASQSPRRKYLLSQAGLNFTIIPSGFDEEMVKEPDPEILVRILARAKAGDVAKANPESWVIGADTIVLMGEKILGKPGSKEDARAMLERLSGKTHLVLTGYSICCESIGHVFTDLVKTEVSFKKLKAEEIDWYIGTSEPFDKAGAYAIQGLGTFLVKSINGSYTNVVGLPVCEVIEHLIGEGVIKRKPEK